MMSLRSNQSGMTIVELLVVIAASSIMMIVVTGFGLNFWTNTAVLQNDEDTLVSRMNSGDYIRNAFNSASGLITQNSLADSHTLSVDPGDVAGTHWLIIHAMPQTVNMPSSGNYTPLIYFSRPSLDSSKNIIMNGTMPYQDEVVIYMNGSTKQLMQRVIANPYAPNNAKKTSCPSALASQSCPKDVVIADNIKSVTTRYFSKTGNTIDYRSVVDPITGNYVGPDFPSVEVVELTVNTYKKSQLYKGANTQNQAVIRVALRN